MCRQRVFLTIEANVKRQPRWSWGLVVFAAALSAVGAARAPDLRAPHFERLTAAFKEEIARGSLPGAVIMVARKGRASSRWTYAR